MPLDTELDEFGDSLPIPAANELKFHAVHTLDAKSKAMKFSLTRLSNLTASDAKKEEKQNINSSSSSTDPEESAQEKKIPQ